MEKGDIFCKKNSALCHKGMNNGKAEGKDINSIWSAYKEIRTGLKLSQDEVVMTSDRLIKAAVSDIENGKRNLSFSTLIDLAQGLGKSPKDLLDFKLPIGEDI
jgi:hypothetical protein